MEWRVSKKRAKNAWAEMMKHTKSRNDWATACDEHGDYKLG